MADTSSLVASKRFVYSSTLASDIQTWYRALNVGTLKQIVSVPDGQGVRLIVVYEAP